MISSDVNDPLPNGDPVMNTTVTISETLPSPFAGLSMNYGEPELADIRVNEQDIRPTTAFLKSLNEDYE